MKTCTQQTDTGVYANQPGFTCQIIKCTLRHLESIRCKSESVLTWFPSSIFTLVLLHYSQMMEPRRHLIKNSGLTHQKVHHLAFLPQAGPSYLASEAQACLPTWLPHSLSVDLPAPPPSSLFITSTPPHPPLTLWHCHSIPPHHHHPLRSSTRKEESDRIAE